ncbi:MAG TPA: SGNH/GDSL hydrolase family protein [Nostocaceae cyanobacterium]|nr:SGNH/GDSL hydrolase family protein [Nostocaceae cyanobacterium]
MLAVALLIGRQQQLNSVYATKAQPSPTTQTQPQLGTRHKLSYEQWLDILKQEAQAAAEKKPQNLTVLAGDSLSLWFPPELLPDNTNWLNQGISGETSSGLLKRLDLFDRTQPEKIFIMIGINDLIRGIDDQEILANQRRIMRYLRRTHPQAQIVVQSILPHGAETATWEGKDKLLAIPNSRISQLNEEIKKIAKRQGVKYLDLYPLFTNKQGNLHPNFTTDGLHLSPQGYLVWRTALQMSN